MIYNSVDCVIFGFKDEKLKVLLIKRNNEPQKGLMALPGDFLDSEVSIYDSAQNTLKELTSLENIYLEQIRAFGEIDRYPGKRVITISYYALINIEDYSPQAGYTAEKLEWCDINALPKLAFDHDEIINIAHKRLKRRVRTEPIGFNLLPEEFSLTNLQQVYEAILQMELNKRNFRTKINQMKLLIDTGKKQENVAHKPAKLYRFDENIYEKLKEEGFYFNL
ncbi:NUDIX hydrolase [Wenyingzhuangia marina]|uniref:8-oxo-dGTP diphosphatase n=1 Tax=Wenyingzhuangia marina TaxID=1195760 RepID=A0A1M5UM39_9FLAO|nr:NUDIX domain-containing protein [Wenyingzhuangia marina]GGF66906.1 DNA mismatch repair protein MutT [Wenyingzhuangia marina]SHH64000.1 8-oxo-dGTP diphosphatase [Wenyingzhuangia marina]